MYGRITSRLSTILALLQVAGQTPLMAAEPQRPTATLRIAAPAMSAVRLPVVSPSPEPARQATYLAQPAESASVGPFPDPVSWETLVEYALANNREIQAARYHARALRARVPQAASLPDPTLISTVYLQSLQTAAGPQDVILSLAQRFPWFGKRGLRSDVAYHEAMAAYARVAAEELQVAEDVKRAYFDLHYLQNAIAETRRLEPRLNDVIEIARTRWAQGAGKETYLQARIELSKLNTSLINLESDLAKAQARLAAALHLPSTTRITAMPGLTRQNLTHTVGVLVELAEASQPELEAQRREICRDRSATALAQRNYWPDVTMSVNWHEIGSTGLSPVANGDDAYSLGVGLNLPLYRQRLDAAVREARSKTASTARRYSAARDRVRAEVQSLAAQFAEHDRTLAILQSEIVPWAAETLDLSLEAYRNKLLEFQQLIDAYRTLLNYRIDYHRRLALREQTLASLERVVGRAITGALPEAAVAPEQPPTPPPPGP
jgi:outer membrane protein TolC